MLPCWTHQRPQVCMYIRSPFLAPSPRMQVERERQVLEGQTELKSVLARYRGPLLEAAIDLEQRIYHLLVQADGSGSIINPEEEVVYSLFTLAQVGVYSGDPEAVQLPRKWTDGPINIPIQYPTKRFPFPPPTVPRVCRGSSQGGPP